MIEIKSQKMKHCDLVTVVGRVDSATAPELEKALLGLIQAGQKNIVVNMRDTEYISSAGLKAILMALMRVRKAIPPGNVVISEIRPELRESFDLVGLDRLFTFYEQDVLAVGHF
jgi:anti-sigma B factor antagonist